GKFERSEISPDAWKQFRLVNGVYSQRQEGDAMMVRVKIPQGVLTPAQLRALADVAERYSIGRGHITTRQNVQFHFVHLADTDDALRLLAEAGITTRAACGDAVVRLFNRTGDRQHRHRARLKFVVEKLGPEEFLRQYHEERKTLEPRPVSFAPAAARPPLANPRRRSPKPGFEKFADTNVRP